MKEFKFTGRKDELNLLTSALDYTKKGLGKIVLVSGEPGSGKSTLIRHFIAQNDLSCLTAIVECTDKEGLMPWQPFKSSLEQLNADYVAESTEEKGKVLSGLKEVMKDVGADWITKIPVIGQFADIAFLGVKTAQSAKKHFSKQKNVVEAATISGPQQIFELIEKELRRLAEKRPIIIFLDDLQWTDNSSLNMLFAISRSLRANPFPLLLIGSYRPHEIKQGRNIITESGANKTVRHPLEDKINELRNYTKKEIHINREDNWFVEFALDSFNLDEVKELVNNKFPDNKFSENFYKQLTEQTNGHVLFLSETLDYLIDNDNIFKNEEGHFVLNPDKTVDFPQSVTGVISERLDRLDDQLRKIIECASVSGEDFSMQIIESILKIDELDLLDYFEELNKKHGLLLPYKSLMIKDLLLELYRFSNNLVQKYIYDNLDAPRRRILHKKTALVIKQLYGDEVETDDKIREQYNKHIQIANGLIEPITGQLLTVDKEEMNDNLSEIIELADAELKSAKSSYEQFAMDECIEHANRVLAFLGKAENLNEKGLQIYFNALKHKQEALSWQGLYNQALDIAQQMFVLASENNNKENIAAAYRLLGKEYRKLGMNEKSLRNYYEESEILKSVGDKQLIAENYSDIGWVLSLLARYQESIEYQEKSLSIAKEIDNKEIVANALNRMGNAYRSLGSYKKSLEYFEESLTIYFELNKKERIAALYNNMGLTYSMLGDYDMSLKKFSECLEIDKEIDNQVNVANDYINIGNIYMYRGDYSNANEYYLKGQKTFEELDDKVSLSQTYISIGSLYQSLGEYSNALNHYKKSLAINTELKDYPQMAIDYIAIGGVQRSMGDYDAAIKSINKTIELYQELDDESGIASGYLTLAGIYNKTYEYDKAIEILNSAINTFEQSEMEIFAASAYHEIGYSYERLDDFDNALVNYQKAFDVYNRLDDKINISSSYNYLGGLYYVKNEYDTALSYYIKGLEIDEELDNKMNMATSYNNIANIYKEEKNDFDKAIEYYQKAIDITLQTDDVVSLILYYENIAKTYKQQHNTEKVIENYLKCAELNAQIGRDETVASNYTDLGEILMYEGDSEQAEVYLNKALEFALATKNNSLIGGVYNDLGYMFHNLDEHQKAVDNYTKAVDYYTLANDTEGITRNQRNLSLLFSASDNAQAAVNYHKQRFEKYLEIGDLNSALDVLIDIAEEYSYKKDFKSTIDSYDYAIEFAKKNNLHERLSRLYNDRGVEYVSFNDTENALIDYHQAVKYNEQFGQFDSQALNLKNIAELYLELNNFERCLTYMNKAIEVSAKSEDLTYNVRLKDRLAKIYKNEKNISEAEKLFMDSLETAKLVGNSVLGEAYNEVGLFYEDIENLDKALEMFQKALEIAEEFKISDNLGLAYRNVAEVLYKLEKSQEAENYFTKSYDINKEIPNYTAMSYLSYRLARIYYFDYYDLEVAASYFKRAADEYKEDENYEMVANVKYGLGVVYYDDNKAQEALNEFYDAADIYKNLHDFIAQADSLVEAAKIYKDYKQYEDAIKLYKESIDIYNRNDETFKAASSYFQIGVILRIKEDCENALNYLNSALHIYGDSESKREIAATNVEIGLVKKCLGNPNDEIIDKYFKPSLKTFTAIDDYWNIANTSKLCGEFYAETGKNIEAIECFKNAIPLFERTNDSYNLGYSNDYCGYLYARVDNLSESKKYFQTALKIWEKSGIEENVKETRKMINSINEQLGESDSFGPSEGDDDIEPEKIN